MHPGELRRQLVDFAVVRSTTAIAPPRSPPSSRARTAMTRTPSDASSAPAHDRGGHLAHRVADHRGGLDAVGPPQLRQRHLVAEQHGLGDLHPLQTGAGGQPFAQGETALRGQQDIELLHGGGERRLLGQQPTSHAGPLAAVPGEDPHRPAPDQATLVGDDPGMGPVLCQRVQRGEEFLPVAGDDGGARPAASGPPGERARHVRRVRRAPLGRAQPLGQPGRGVPDAVGVDVGEEMQTRGRFPVGRPHRTAGRRSSSTAWAFVPPNPNAETPAVAVPP